MEDSSETLLKSAIHLLCYSILLRLVELHVLPFNALHISKVFHAVIHVLSSLVIMQHVYLPVSAVLSASFGPLNSWNVMLFTFMVATM